MINQKELIKKLLKATDIIHKKRIETNTNWMIVSPQIAEIIENLDIKIQRRKKLEQINKKTSE